IASSSDPSIVAEGGIVLGGSGGARTLTVSPVHDASGKVTLTVTVTDGLSSATTGFDLVVTPRNDDPSLGAIPTPTTDEDVPLTISVPVADVDSPLANLKLVGKSSNQTLLPDGNITVTGTGATRSLTLAPAHNLNGSATVTLTLSDGDGGSATTTFLLNVNPV